MFWRNFRRDLSHTATRLLSVIIITAVAVMLYAGFSCMNYTVNQLVGQYYRDQNVADYWITGQNFNQTDCNKLLKIDGIEDVQPRVTLPVENRYDSDITLSLYTVSKEISINIPKIFEGKLPAGNGDMMIGREFAQAQGLHVGDRYEMKIPGTGTLLKMRICALVQDPECMYNVDAKNLIPDPSHYGFAYISEDAISLLYGKNIYNQICITITDSADKNTIVSSVNAVLSTKVVNVVALEDNESAYNMLSITNSIKNIVLVFPTIFFAVAALIMFSTMSRLIENARMAIGTFKALGYEGRQIMLYYLMYAILVTNVGFFLGLLPVKIFVTFVMQIIFRSMDVPSYQFAWNITANIIAYGVTCVVCIGTAYVITRRELEETPAQCMRPSVQKAARKNFLERISFLWNRFGFTQKYTARNIFRNKMRMAVCVIGIAGCMTLIMMALGIMDSINNYLNVLENKSQKFDLLVTLDSTVTDNQSKHLETLDGVTAVQSAMTTGVKMYSSGREYTSYLTVTDDEISLNLIDPYGPSVMDLPADGVILDQKIADTLEVSVGETIKAKVYGDNSYYDMKVTDIIPSINGAYVGRTMWRNIGKGFTPTTLYLETNDTASVTERLNNYQFVTNVQNKSSVMEAARSNVMSIVSIVIVFIVFGGLLAFIVLYNLGIVSFFEQIRNLATLMVLGFYDKEIKKLVLSENIIFTFIGVLIGAPFGLLLTSAILGSIDIISFQTYVRPYSYPFAGALTLTFALIVNLMLSSQMRKIDMLGALKSVE